MVGIANSFQHPDLLDQFKALYRSNLPLYTLSGILVGFELIVVPQILPQAVVEVLMLPAASFDLTDWKNALACILLLQMDRQFWSTASRNTHSF